MLKTKSIFGRSVVASLGVIKRLLAYSFLFSLAVLVFFAFALGLWAAFPFLGKNIFDAAFFAFWLYFSFFLYCITAAAREDIFRPKLAGENKEKLEEDKKIFFGMLRTSIIASVSIFLIYFCTRIFA
ncbi:MAG: hypothetical protein WC397_01010 [Candidatus Paceibacterota bacterium]|jgi:hypothetical protein